MQIAICQTHIVWENKEQNIFKAKSWCKKASQDGADLILFPEMSFTGFSMNTVKTAETDFDLYTMHEIRNSAIENNINIGFGWVYKPREKYEDAKCENHYTIIDKHGQIVSDYVKIHPFSYSGEEKYFEGGNEIANYIINEIPFSTLICYDLRFPEIFQAISDTAHVIIVPSQWPEKRRNHWMSLLQARAIENQVYIVGINSVGEAGGLQYSGDSRVINPNGVIVAEVKNKEETILYYELEDDVDSYRSRFPVKNDRKRDLYLRLLE